MGTWGHGPFDNDTAADWCGALHHAVPTERRGLIRAALTAAAMNEDYLDSDDADAAIAAAAIVASGLPWGTPVTSPYAPDFLLAGDSVETDEDLPELAVRALDRIVGDESEWRSLWNESGRDEFPIIDRLRAELSGPPLA